MSGALFGDWDKLNNFFDPRALKSRLDKAKEKIGAVGASDVKRTIRDGKAPDGTTFKPLSHWTVAKKHSSKPLIDNGDLIGSATYQVDEDGITIGVNRKEGDVNIAAVHEFGITIEVTPKMRAYLHSQGIHLKPDTNHIVIPERSYLRSTINSEEFGEKALEILQEAFIP